MSSQASDFELSFYPSLRLVSVVRRFVEELYAGLNVDPELVSRLAVAAHELLENAAKYGGLGPGGIHIALGDAPGDPAEIRVWNHCTAEQLADLRQAFNELGAASDPLAYYVECMRRASRLEHGSRLGLARVRAECEMKLDLGILGNRVEIRATTAKQKDAA